MSNKEIMKISVDVGSGFTQSTDGKKIEVNFSSIVCPVPKEKEYGMDLVKGIVEIDGESFLVGDPAYSYGIPDSRLDTLSANWAGSTGWHALLYTALHKCNIKQKSTIHLITGIPQEIYSDLNDLISRALNKTHFFKIDDEEYQVTINALVVPQATGALVYKAITSPEIKEKRIGMIDIGTYTSGFAVSEKGSITSHKSGGCRVGVSQIIKMFKENLLKKYGQGLDDTVIPEVLMAKKVELWGEEKDVSVDVEKFSMQAAESILAALEKKWGSGMDLRIYVAGGGAPFFIDAIKTQFPHAEVIDDAFYAVVRGMHNLLSNAA